MSKEFNVSEIMGSLNTEIRAEHQAVAKAIIGPLVLFTPVGMPETWKTPPPPNYKPGHARASWKTSLNTGSGGDTEGVDPGGAATIARGVGTIRRAKVTQRIVFQNNAKYIGPLNDGTASPQTNGPDFVGKAIRGGLGALPSGRKALP